MTRDFIVRPVEEKDRHDLAALLCRNYFNKETGSMDASEQDLLAERTDAQIRTSLDSHSPNQLFVATVDDAPVALAYVIADHKRGGFIVDDLFTKKEFEGRGIASSMLKACERHCHALGANDIHLSVIASNKPLVDYYARRGWLKQIFSETGQGPADIDPANRIVATHLMKKTPQQHP